MDSRPRRGTERVQPSLQRDLDRQGGVAAVDNLGEGAEVGEHANGFASGRAVAGGVSRLAYERRLLEEGERLQDVRKPKNKKRGRPGNEANLQPSLVPIRQPLLFNKS